MPFNFTVLGRNKLAFWFLSVLFSQLLLGSALSESLPVLAQSSFVSETTLDSQVMPVPDAVVTVTEPIDDSSPGTLSQALTAVANGGTINISLHSGTVLSANGLLIIPPNVKIVGTCGASLATTIINGQNVEFQLQGNNELEGINLHGVLRHTGKGNKVRCANVNQKAASLYCNPFTGTLDAQEQAFLTLINQYRQANGRSALTVNQKLTNAAKWLSGEMSSRNYFSHTDSLGRGIGLRLPAFGYLAYQALAENIYAGSQMATSAMNSWKNSPGHNDAMLSTNYTEIGIGRACNTASTWRWYWTTTFGKPQ